MDVFRAALDSSLSPKARVPSSQESEADVFRWPDAAPDAEPAAAPGFWTAVFDYEATADDELSLRRGDLVEVLSKDSLVSGDEGWWTGMIADRVGIFPSNYVSRGNGIPEEMRDASEQRYSVPPLHREYPIVLHCCADETTNTHTHTHTLTHTLTHTQHGAASSPRLLLRRPERGPGPECCVTIGAVLPRVGLDTGRSEHPVTASGPLFGPLPPHLHLHLHPHPPMLRSQTQRCVRRHVTAGPAHAAAYCHRI